MKLYQILVLLCLTVCSTTLTSETTTPRIQLALLLDTSNSMDGLIDQARQELWSIVNEFALARRGGHIPTLEIGLYEYGNDGLNAEGGHIRQVLPFSTDLDLLSEKLFALTTNGGSEYCAWVIKKSVADLAWDQSDDVLKVIFIAGNEPFTQGPIDHTASCRQAISRGIIINAIFCGAYDEGVRTSWKDAADMADGHYMNIDQDQVIVQIDAPQDGTLAQLNKELNDTYIYYGQKGAESKRRQEMQDMHAFSSGASTQSKRALAKAGANYKNSSWDLVDAAEEGTIDLEEVETEELPEELRELDTAELRAHIDVQMAKRTEIKKEITRLSAERKEYVAQKTAEQASESTLGNAIINVVRKQALQKDFTFEK